MATMLLSYIPQKYYLNQTAHFSPQYIKTLFANRKVACHDDGDDGDDDDDNNEMHEKRNTHTHSEQTSLCFLTTSAECMLDC
jgi:hypothetical protein